MKQLKLTIFNLCVTLKWEHLNVLLAYVWDGSTVVNVSLMLVSLVPCWLEWMCWGVPE